MGFEEKRTDKQTKTDEKIHTNTKQSQSDIKYIKRATIYIYIYSAIKPNQNIKRGSVISPNFHISAIEWIGI